ncbi:hypothetical protein [Wolbachia endosymbiont of Ctenocephalides felis wCfeJ]|uniref:hypothetical protein n=1 Tax=Wolbachia endosymbiont of Ctenocephalides felis wCfeJ TaxID=2732594 RepID=UPI0014465324|nr:hypothetical protein [Wolbachia endosymbiont of Ctenocephalides felis wCfeJ]WCR58352.1 MAG: hypothetical protein PG980_000824 [Wolbachia endosymbiont of Ctenocephalides felis wCfeJ]
MNDDYLFENGSEENNDDKRERNLQNENQIKEQQEKIERYVQDYLEAFEAILNQVDEEIDNLDSYERTMQVKRSIDRLIETLYSQAASEDIDAEFETTKHTRDRSESMKRVAEKRKKQIMEEVLSSMFAQQQKEMMNAKHLSHRHETTPHDEDVLKAKARIKSSIKGVLFSVIAHRMDPRRRAGETADSNERQARIYGREAVGGALSALLKTFLTAVTAVIREIAKPLQHTNKQETSFAKQVEESRNIDPHKGRSM